MPKIENKPIVAVDVDDVISDQVENIRAFANNRYGHNHTIEDYKVEGPYWGYWQHVWGVSSDEDRRRMSKYNENELSNQQLIKGSVGALKKLKKDYTLVIITSRDESLTEKTHLWLEKHFPDVFDSIHFVPIWEDGTRATKATICREIGAGYLIDDNPEHCNLAAKVGVTSLLFGSYGWQQNAKMHKDVVRVADWKEVLEYFNAKS